MVLIRYRFDGLTVYHLVFIQESQDLRFGLRYGMPLYGRSAYAKCRNRILYFIFTIAFALAELIVYEYVISIIVRIRAGKFWHYTLLRLLLNPFRRIKENCMKSDWRF